MEFLDTLEQNLSEKENLKTNMDEKIIKSALQPLIKANHGVTSSKDDPKLLSLKFKTPITILKIEEYRILCNVTFEQKSIDGVFQYETLIDKNLLKI